MRCQVCLLLRLGGRRRLLGCQEVQLLVGLCGVTGIQHVLYHVETVLMPCVIHGVW